MLRILRFNDKMEGILSINPAFTMMMNTCRMLKDAGQMIRNYYKHFDLLYIVVVILCFLGKCANLGKREGSLNEAEES